MAILRGFQNPNNPIAANTSGQLSGLPVGAFHVSSATTFSNLSGDTQGGGMPYLTAVFYGGFPVSGTWGASGAPAVYGWILQALDGTRYETTLNSGPTTTPPVARAADLIWPYDLVSGASTKVAFGTCPLGSGLKMAWWNNVGQQFPGSGVKCDLYFSTDATQ